ncbi:MAG: DUF86 domain-containing protein [Candidatus Aminicenantes bacterium]|nr:DUF86 domain-containing protein [Candidatus Aminicenantes bacterium]
MVDKTLILRKIAELSEYLDQTQEFQDISIQAYTSDWKTQRIVERTLQMMIEVCADMASHIISDAAYRVPKTYADAFRVLHENAILNEGLSAKMERMAKFRNIVVHQYDDIDAEIVVGILKKHLADFSDFKEAILGFLREN